MTKSMGSPAHQGPDALGRVRLLERLVIQDQIAMAAVAGGDAEAGLIPTAVAQGGAKVLAATMLSGKMSRIRAASPRQRCWGSR